MFLGSRPVFTNPVHLGVKPTTGTTGISIGGNAVPELPSVPITLEGPSVLHQTVRML
jgi:hypothetical protein